MLFLSGYRNVAQQYHFDHENGSIVPPVSFGPRFGQGDRQIILCFNHKREILFFVFILLPGPHGRTEIYLY